MGEEELNAADFTEAVVEAMRRVASRRVPISAQTPIDRTTIDSLGIIEMMVHLEELVGQVFDEKIIRQAVLEPDYRASMAVGDFARMLRRLAYSADAPAGPGGPGGPKAETDERPQ